MKKLIVVVLTALALTATVLISPAQAAIPTGGKNTGVKARVYAQSIEGGAYCQIVAAGTAYWTKHPKKKGITRGHYLRINVAIETRAGSGGTLWKTLAKKTFKQDTIVLSQPPRGSGPNLVAYNTRYGGAEYRAKVTIRVMRDVRPGVDTTAWKRSVTTKSIIGTDYCGGRPSR